MQLQHKRLFTLRKVHKNRICFQSKLDPSTGAFSPKKRIDRRNPPPPGGVFCSSGFQHADVCASAVMTEDINDGANVGNSDNILSEILGASSRVATPLDLDLAFGAVDVTDGLSCTSLISPLSPLINFGGYFAGGVLFLRALHSDHPQRRPSKEGCFFQSTSPYLPWNFSFFDFLSFFLSWVRISNLNSRLSGWCSSD